MNLHKTRDGKVMLIEQMDNEHLLNTIRLAFRKSLPANHCITGELAGLLGLPEAPSPRDIGERKADILLALAPLITEAALRALPELPQILQDFTGRSGAIDGSLVLSMSELSHFDSDDLYLEDCY